MAMNKWAKVGGSERVTLNPEGSITAVLWDEHRERNGVEQRRHVTRCSKANTYTPFAMKATA